MRLFVGIDLPTSVRDRISSRVTAFRPTLPPARWTAAQGYHVTLSFLGSVDGKDLGRVERCVKASAPRCGSFSLQLHSAGVFPLSRGPIRVLWIGVADPEPVIALQRQIAAGLVEAGLLEPDERPYHPHVTLARCKKPWKRSVAEHWQSFSCGPIGAPFRVRDTVLFRSSLSPAGATYERLRTFKIGEAT